MKKENESIQALSLPRTSHDEANSCCFCCSDARLDKIKFLVLKKYAVWASQMIVGVTFYKAFILALPYENPSEAEKFWYISRAFLYAASSGMYFWCE